ncbi:hypothetical protein LY474_12840 [Myxococcus stipitatus]|uniref:hypothetical protein n=1 Tax=Myxococcus stipitatus TaxID=83455 RepID=UPI001F2B861D|nr:hypothetical protein [Myxococcus stipitatus]MCE9668703.1 hypothetical protein [Myxococcus stipitatus]
MGSPGAASLGAGATLLVAATAWGALKVHPPITVDLAARYAGGSMAAARGGGDVTQFIGCSVFSFAMGAPVVHCAARDASSVQVACTSSSLRLTEVVQGIHGDSLVQFHWDATGACTRVVVTHASGDAPKAP